MLLLDAAELGTASLEASLASACLLALGGWLGGRLVYTFGADVRNELQPLKS